MAKKDFKKNPAEMFMSTPTEKKEEEKKEVNANLSADALEEIATSKGYRLLKETKSERMQLLIRPTLKTAIKEEAAAQGLSMNDLVNNIFEEYLERRKGV